MRCLASMTVNLLDASSTDPKFQGRGFRPGATQMKDLEDASLSSGFEINENIAAVIRSSLRNGGSLRRLLAKPTFAVSPSSRDSHATRDKENDRGAALTRRRRSTRSRAPVARTRTIAHERPSRRSAPWADRPVFSASSQIIGSQPNRLPRRLRIPSPRPIVVFRRFSAEQLGHNLLFQHGERVGIAKESRHRDQEIVYRGRSSRPGYP